MLTKSLIEAAKFWFWFSKFFFTESPFAQWIDKMWAEKHKHSTWCGKMNLCRVHITPVYFFETNGECSFEFNRQRPTKKCLEFNTYAHCHPAKRVQSGHWRPTGWKDDAIRRMDSDPARISQSRVDDLVAEGGSVAQRTNTHHLLLGIDVVEISRHPVQRQTLGRAQVGNNDAFLPILQIHQRNLSSLRVRIKNLPKKSNIKYKR